jgi:hypothetical protein
MLAPSLDGPAKQNMELDLRFPAVSLLAEFCSLPDHDNFPAGRRHGGPLTYGFKKDF